MISKQKNIATKMVFFMITIKLFNQTVINGNSKKKNKFQIKMIKYLIFLFNFSRCLDGKLKCFEDICLINEKLMEEINKNK